MPGESRLVAVCPHCHSTAIAYVEVREVITSRVVEVEGEENPDFVTSGEDRIYRTERNELPSYIEETYYACEDCDQSFGVPATAEIGNIQEPQPNPRLPEEMRNLLRGEEDVIPQRSSILVRLNDTDPF